MNFIDVFNGDANKLCAPHQLRLSQPANSIPTTGIKRDIELHQRVKAEMDDIVTMLERGIQVRYFDHHFVGDVPTYSNLDRHINLSADNFVEVYVNTPLEICETRAVKGLYKKARSGQPPNFSTISSAYEPPISPAIEVNSNIDNIENAVHLVAQKNRK